MKRINNLGKRRTRIIQLETRITIAQVITQVIAELVGSLMQYPNHAAILLFHYPLDDKFGQTLHDLCNIFLLNIIDTKAKSFTSISVYLYGFPHE